MRARGRTGEVRREGGEEGFLLIGALIAVFLVLLVLSVAAPTVARQLRREREVEAVHRGDQYVRAIQLYYKKTGHYPGSVEQLEKTNNIRFLRQKYVDPMTGKADWRLIHLGEQKTTIKGFFGQPLTGVASSGIGGTSPGIGGPQTVNGAGGGIGSGSASGLGGGLGSSNGTATVADSAGSSGSAGVSSQSATSFQGSGAPIVGFGSSGAGSSMVVLNEQTTYPTWEFIYDPRIEALKAKVNLLGGGMASTSATGFGSGNSLNPRSSATTSGAGSPNPGASPAPTTTPPPPQ